MRGETENRAEKYIRNHKNRKKWLAFVLCLSLFTGTATLYGLNKPATAMTEEGAGQVGLVMETADNEFEQGLIEQMHKDEVSGETTVSLNEEEDGDQKAIEMASVDQKSGEEIEEAENSTEGGAEGAEGSSASNSSLSDDRSVESSSASTSASLEESAGDASSEASSGNSLDGTKAASSASSASSSQKNEDSADDDEEYKDVEINVLYTDLSGEEIAESKALSIEKSFEIPDEVSELEGYIFDKAVILNERITKIEKKTEKVEIASSIEENPDSVASYISEEEENKKIIEYTYYEATTVNGDVIEIREDTDLILQYFAVNTQDKFVFADGDVTVTVSLSDPGVLPEGVELSVKTVDAQTEGYNYEAYMEALNLNSQVIAEASQAETEENSENKKAVYDETNTVLFDIAFMLDSVEYEPTDGTVSVSVKFNNKQISEGLDLTEEDEIAVVHLPLSSEVMENVNSTSEATEITSDDIALEVYKEGTVSFENDADVISYETESFSITAVLKTTQDNQEHTWKGTNEKSATEIIEGLGNAKYFGAVADNLEGGSHYETNVAVNNYAETAERVLFDYERTNGGYISSDEYKSYSIVVRKKSTEKGTFYFALFRDEQGKEKISGSEFSFTDSDFTLSDGYYVASHRIEGFTEKNPTVYVYELNGADGDAVLDSNEFGNFTVTYESELNETSNAVDALTSSYITNGKYNETELDTKLYKNATLYFDASDSGWKKGTKDGNNHVTISDQLYDIPTDFVNSILDDAKSVSSVLPYLCDSETVDTFNVIASQYGDYLSDFYSAGKDKYGWTDQNNITDPSKGITFGDNQVLVINLDLTGRTSYKIGQYYLNGQKPDEIYNSFGSIASRVIINPVQKNSNGEYEPYEGALEVENVIGTVLAPCASVTSSGVAGSLIADSICLNGEIHKVSLIGYLKIGGTVEVTNTSINNELELQLYKFINGDDPQNAKFNFTIKRLKDDMTGWSNGKYDREVTDHTALTNDGRSINYKFDPSYWSMTPGNTYYFRITEDVLEEGSAYTIDKSQIYVKVVYKGANDADISYYRLGEEEDEFNYWVNALNAAVSSSNPNPDFINAALINGICNDSDRLVTGESVAFNNTTVKGKLKVNLNKFLNGNLCPDSEKFTFTVRVLNTKGAHLETLTNSLQNEGGSISFEFSYNDNYLYKDSVYFVITENDIETTGSSVTYSKDDDYIIIRVSGLDKNKPGYGYFKYDPTDDKNYIDILEKNVVKNDYNYQIWNMTKQTSHGVTSDVAGFYNTSTSYLRIHKLVVNDFGSDFVREKTLLPNVKFRLTEENGNYIIFQGFTDGDRDREDHAIEYYGDTHAATGNRYTVTYNGNAQWTIQGIPTGLYKVEEVADGLTFSFEHDENSSDAASTILENSYYSRVTMYDVTEDDEGTSFGGTGGQNWRKVFSKDLDITFDSYKAPDNVKVGGETIKTVQICNYYSVPIGPIQVTKNLIGGEWKNMEFTFTMEAVSYKAYDSERNPISLNSQPMPGGSAENSVSVTVSDASVDKDGNRIVKQNDDGTYSAVVQFDSIPFRFEGEYIYKITEVNKNLDGVVYDSSEYYVKVTVEKKYTTFSKTYSHDNNKHSIYAQQGINTDIETVEDFYYLGANVIYSDDKYFNNEIASCELYLGTDPVTSKPIANVFQVKYTKGDVAEVVFNNSLTGRLKVVKNWLDTDGKNDGNNHSALNIYIWQRIKDSNDSWKVYAAQTITPAEDGSWELTVKNLPLTDSDGNAYEYCVKESDEYLATHSVTYEYGGIKYDVSDQGNVTVNGTVCKDPGYVMDAYYAEDHYDYGTVYITNKTIFRNALPSTGGTGTIPFNAVGISIILGSLFGFLLRLKRKNNLI